MKNDKTVAYRNAKKRMRNEHRRSGDISSSALVWTFITVIAFVITVHYLRG